MSDALDEPPMSDGRLRYERCAFSTELPEDRLYTAGHAWLRRTSGSVWRVGLTKFAAKVVGEPVEYDFEVEPGAEIGVGQVIGWIEGFKAVTDLFCPIAGRFTGSNPALGDDIDLIQSDPYERGWLYTVDGSIGTDCFDVHGYAAFLDETIDELAGETREPG